MVISVSLSLMEPGLVLTRKLNKEVKGQCDTHSWWTGWSTDTRQNQDQEPSLCSADLVFLHSGSAHKHTHTRISHGRHSVDRPCAAATPTASPSFLQVSRCQVEVCWWCSEDWTHSWTGRSLWSWNTKTDVKRLTTIGRYNWLTVGRSKRSRDISSTHLWISITSSAIMRPIFPAPALVPPGIPGTVCNARLPPPAEPIRRSRVRNKDVTKMSRRRGGAVVG